MNSDYMRVQHSAICLSMRMEEQPPTWKGNANVLNKQSRTADNGWSFSLGLSEVLTNSHRKIVSCYEMYAQTTSDLG